MEKFQHSLALPNTKYNCSILFLGSNILVICVYFSKYFLLIDHHCKTPRIIAGRAIGLQPVIAEW